MIFANVSAVALTRRLQWARIGVLLLLAITVASAYLTRHCLAVANTRMQSELGFNNEQFGYLYSAFSLGYLICQVPGGWLGQRLGTRLTLALLCGLWSVMTLITGVATTLPALVSARFGFGLMQAGLIPNQAQVIKDWFPSAGHGTASAVIVTAMSVGSFASLWLTARLIDIYHWRTLFFAYSVAGILWSIFLYAVFRSHPHEVQSLQLEVTSSAPESVVEKSDRKSSNRLAIWAILGGLSFWALFSQMILKAAGYNLLVTFFPSYLEMAFEISPQDAGELTSWSLVAVVVGSLLGGRLIDQLQQRTGSRRISRVGVAALTLLLTAIIMGAASSATTARQTAILIAASSLIMGVASPCAWAASIDIGGKNTAVVMGFLNMGGALAGILISPLVGRLIDHIKSTHGNWNLVIQVHALFYLIAAVSWLFVNLETSPAPLESTDVV